MCRCRTSTPPCDPAVIGQTLVRSPIAVQGTCILARGQQLASPDRCAAFRNNPVICSSRPPSGHRADGVCLGVSPPALTSEQSPSLSTPWVTAMPALVQLATVPPAQKSASSGWLRRPARAQSWCRQEPRSLPSDGVIAAKLPEEPNATVGCRLGADDGKRGGYRWRERRTAAYAAAGATGADRPIRCIQRAPLLQLRSPVASG
jgi:hypothetical protein